jgi:hypothetical protein
MGVVMAVKGAEGGGDNGRSSKGYLAIFLKGRHV